MSEVTQVNTRLQNENATVINHEAENSSFIEEGTFLCDGFIVERKLETVTGEADLYICNKDSGKFVAKVYRRKVAVKDEIIEKLSKLSSPNVARVYAAGEYGGYPVEIIPYYRNGSLQGRTYTYTELKHRIIPSLNEGLHILHENGIIHKDLKPSNIMLNDNGADVSIIDFGISSAREFGNTVIVTQTGMTPEYSAPETFRNLFLSESDYYSFGITIYELFCGHTPYVNMSADEIEKYVVVQRIPFPEGMPDDLKDLIGALTYYDITNRKNKSNPNRRWGYEEVRKWCAGEKQIIPGEGIGNVYGASEMPPYKFMGKVYNEKSKLVSALGTNWDEGKKQLFRGLLSEFFKIFDPEIAGFCLDAEEEAAGTTGKEDAIFFQTLYRIDAETTIFYWRGNSYENLEKFGTDMLQRLWNHDDTIDSFFGSILGSGVLSLYAQSVGSADGSIMRSLQDLESSYQTLGETKENRIRVYFLAAYMLSGKKILNVSDRQFVSIDEVASYMNELLDASYASFDRFCRILMREHGDLDPQFESWLIAIGKQNEVRNWREGLL